jgi:tetratricopeptide (TPR) repeat protein
MVYPCLVLFMPLLAWAGIDARAADANWQALINNRPKDVLRVYDAAKADRAGQLAAAVAIMSMQPATDANMRRAGEIFSEVAQGSDGLAAQALYLQARLHQLHFQVPDYAAAAQCYEQLAARQPDSHWAQLGLVKLALLKLYVLDIDAGADRLATAEPLLERIHEPALQRDLHLQIGQAGVVLKQPLRRFIPHLVAADQLGGISGTAKEDLVVQIGELSLRAGLLEQSKAYFERYLRTYPDNLRAYAVARRLEETNRQLAARGEVQP